MGFGKKKIEIKKIEKQSRRMVTFSKRRKGLFKKAEELRSKTGAKVGILVISASGKPYPYGDIDAIEATLNACISTHDGSNFGVCSISAHDGSNSGVCSSNNLRLRQLLDEVSVEECYNIEELLMLKRKLEEAKENMIRAEVESWTL